MFTVSSVAGQSPRGNASWLVRSTSARIASRFVILPCLIGSRVLQLLWRGRGIKQLKLFVHQPTWPLATVRNRVPLQPSYPKQWLFDPLWLQQSARSLRVAVVNGPVKTGTACLKAPVDFFFSAVFLLKMDFLNYVLLIVYSCWHDPATACIFLELLWKCS